jgi:hypothetical protein
MSLNNKCAKCGCEDSYLTTPPPCPTAIGCPFEECAEIQYAQCIMYTGGDILCNGDLVVPTDTNMEAAITNIVDYFCLPPIPEITCNGDIVITEDSTINEALEDIVSYFCLPPIPEITCNDDIVVTEDSSINEALEDIVNYFCLTPIPLIQCGADNVVQQGSSINQALEDIVDYFCDQTIITVDIDCNETTVVAADTSVVDAIEDVVDYFCDEIANINIAITAIEGDITTIQGDITTIQGDITAIEGDITTIEGNITTLQADQGLFDTGFRGYISPDSFPSKTFNRFNSNISLGDTVVFDTTNGVIQYQIKDGVNFSQYNQTTGIWTCPETGKYDFNYNVYLSSPANTYGWGEVGGTFTIGITDITGAATIYCADTFTAVQNFYYDKIYMTGGMQGVIISAGTQIVLKIQNLTGVAYTEQRTLGDNIEWAIRRVG